MNLTPQLPSYSPQFCQNNKMELWGQIMRRFRRPITIRLLLPPPNITGELHLGHAWNGFLQDFSARYQLLCGRGVGWYAGTDHAGIATQIKVGKSLTVKQPFLRLRSGITNRQLLSAIWAHRSHHEATIFHQLQQLGLLIDPLTVNAPPAFTLDDKFTLAVNTMFVRLYRDGLIYQGYRIVMWDVVLKTALSNIEIDVQSRQQWLYYFKYYAHDCASEFLVVATSRPETMFVDQALVVNNNDKRFVKWINRWVINPANGQKIRVIGDHTVDQKFGTGVMKCTPGHDQLDFDIGRRHHLAQPVCIDVNTGLINHHGGQYAGLEPGVCRRRLVDRLQRQGCWLKSEQYQTTVPVSCRTQTIVEPILSRQWFVKTKPLAELVQKWQASGEKTNFVPTRFAIVLTKWMAEVQDWCISRQIAWGHRLPVWKNPNDHDQIYVGVTPPDDYQMQQVTDVFDTWFSSALCVLVVNGWPTTPAPSCQSITILVTGYDIIFFWVARMLMFSLYVTGRGLIKNILVHGLVRDHTGRKMSKSLNNGINPLTVIRQYGADSLRLFLITSTTPGLDIKFNPIKLQAGVTFMLKLWNATRYVLTRIKVVEARNWLAIKTMLINDTGQFHQVWNRWITACWLQVHAQFHVYVQRFEYGMAFLALRRWFIHDFCDLYLEVSKLTNHPIVNATLFFCLVDYLRALHVFAPFITETLFGFLTKKQSILNERYHHRHHRNLFGSSVNLVTVIRAVINALRQWKTQFKIISHQTLHFTVIFNEHSFAPNRQLLAMNLVFAKLVKAQFHNSLTSHSGPQVRITFRYGQILLVADRVVDWAHELVVKNKQLLRLRSLLTHCETLVNNSAFLVKAKSAKINDMLERKASLLTQIKQIKSQISEIRTKMIGKANI